MTFLGKLDGPWRGGQCVQPTGLWASPPQLSTVKNPWVPGPLDRARDCSIDSVALVEVTRTHCENSRAQVP